MSDYYQFCGYCDMFTDHTALDETIKKCQCDRCGTTHDVA